MAKLELSEEQKLTLETFFQNLRLFIINSPGAYPDELGFVLGGILNGELSLIGYTTAELSEISSPEAGDIVFNITTGEPVFWDGEDWIPFGPNGAGTVTSVATTADFTGGPITTTGTLGLANTTVVAGTYNLANIVVDAKGRITAAANGTLPTLTPAMVYAAGSAAADQTLLIKASDGGPVIFKADGAATGSLLKAQTNGAISLLDINDNGSQLIKSAMADGASAVALAVDTSTAWANATAKLLSLKTNNVEKFNLTAGGVANFSSYITVPSSTSGGLFNTAGSRGILIDAGGMALQTYAGGISPNTDLVGTSGAAALRWSETWSREYAGALQTNTANGAIAIDTTLGETYTLTANGDITSITLSDGKAGQVFTLVAVQDGVGTSTWATAVANAKLAGGTFTKTTTANAIDTLTFRWNGADWLEIGRTLALS